MLQHRRKHSNWSIRPRLALPDSGPTAPPGVLRVATRMETADPDCLTKPPPSLPIQKRQAALHEGLYGPGGPVGHPAPRVEDDVGGQVQPEGVAAGDLCAPPGDPVNCRGLGLEPTGGHDERGQVVAAASPAEALHVDD